MRLCYYPAPSGVCPFTHVTRERLPAASGGLRKALSCGLPTYVGIVNCSESVIQVTAQHLHAATQARCGVIRRTRKNLHAANFVTCPCVRRNIPGFSVDLPPATNHGLAVPFRSSVMDMLVRWGRLVAQSKPTTPTTNSGGRPWIG